MEHKRKINLRKHTSPPVSKNYLLRIIFYIVLISVLGFIVSSQLEKKEVPKTPEVNEIRNVTIEE
ncbi:MAG: hypothetical protein JKY09_07215 [Crocinitomicaceae bacterium]|nr:hypothetical protein [Crocinitomicaceae bacterium]